MVFTRTRLIVLTAVVALLGAAGVFVLGDRPEEIQAEAARNVIKIEAAGVDYGGWPEMGIAVNDQSIGNLMIDSQQRKTFTIDVPNEIDPISTIHIKFNNQSYCQNVGTAACDLRNIIFRSIHLNDKKLEGGVPSGENNTIYSLQTATGGLTWKIDG